MSFIAVISYKGSLGSFVQLFHAFLRSDPDNNVCFSSQALKLERLHKVDGKMLQLKEPCYHQHPLHLGT